MFWMLDTPVPTPTPIPLSQVGAQVSQLVDKSEIFYSAVIQYGALGILALFILFLIVVAIVAGLFVYTRRNQKSKESAESQSTLTLGSIALSLQEQLKIAQQQLEAERKRAEEQTERWLDQQRKMKERDIESLSAMTAAQESVRQLVREIKGLFDSSIQKDKERDERFATLNANIAQIVGEGSEPVQNIHKMVTDIRDEMKKLSEAVKHQKVDYAAIKDALQPAFTEVITVIREQKRKTDKIPVIEQDTGSN